MISATTSDGAVSRGVPWVAAVALHGAVGGLLALTPAPLPPVPPESPVVEIVLVAELPPAPQPPPAQMSAAEPAPTVAAEPAPTVVEETPAPPVHPMAHSEAHPEAHPEARPVVRPVVRPPTPPARVAPPGASAVAATAAVAAPAAETAGVALPSPSPTVAAWDGAGLANPPPVYPRSARLAGQEGRVVVRVQVAADGTVTSLHVVTSSGTDALDTAAVRAVRGWRFHPATRHGKPVADAVDVPVVFRLRG
ncbi:MAG: TonB family protein [Rhodospirillaceae bacterium]